MSTFKDTILITGGTTGLGRACAQHLAAQQPDTLILLASRTHTANAAATINATTKHQNVKYLPLDLSSLAQIRSFAADYTKAHYPPLKSLLLNAGLQLPGPVQLTPDGIETTFAVNHVGHALLFHLLQGQLSADAHVVLTSSGTHDPAQKTGLPDAVYDSAAALARPGVESQRVHNGRQRYATSKLCNVLWMYALERRGRAAGKGWTVNAYDPGLMPGTGLARDGSWIERFLWFRVLPLVIPVLDFVVGLLTPGGRVVSAGKSGRLLADLATGVGGVGSGKYVSVGRVIESSKDSYDEGKQEDLWRWTVDFLARDESEKESWLELK